MVTHLIHGALRQITAHGAAQNSAQPWFQLLVATNHNRCCWVYLFTLRLRFTTGCFGQRGWWANRAASTNTSAAQHSRGATSRGVQGLELLLLLLARWGGRRWWWTTGRVLALMLMLLLLLLELQLGSEHWQQRIHSDVRATARCRAGGHWLQGRTAGTRLDHGVGHCDGLCTMWGCFSVLVWWNLF